MVDLQASVQHGLAVFSSLLTLAIVAGLVAIPGWILLFESKKKKF